MDVSEVSDILCYNPEFKVLICLECQHCLIPEGINRHLRDYHGSIAIDRRKRMIERVEQLEIMKPEDIILPSNEIEAIEGLKVVKGIQCTTCGAIYGTVGSMKTHCWHVHGWVQSKGFSGIQLTELMATGPIWQEQSLQSFYITKHLKYFRVRERMDGRLGDPDIDLLLRKGIRADEERAKLDHIVKQKEGRGENSPWLSRTGWKSMFMNKDMAKLSEYTNGEDVTDTELFEVKKSIERMLDNCIYGVEDLDMRGWTELRFWLRSHSPLEPHEKPFRKSVTELKKYKDIWTRLILFCWRAFEIDEQGVEFLDCQRDAIARLRDAICLMGSDEWAVDRLTLKLSVSLIKHSDFERQKSVVKYFAGILGYNVREGRWKRPNHYTRILAGLQFCMRVILLEDSVPMEERDYYQHGTGKTPLEAFRTVHEKWLVDGAGTPYSWVHKLLNYGMTVAKDATGADRVRFSADKQHCYFDGHGFKVQEWKDMIRDIVRTMERVLSRDLLFRDEDTITPMNPYDLVDNEYIHENGHYFAYLLSDHRHRARKVILEALRRSKSKWDSLVREDCTFNPDGVAKYDKSVSEFLELLLLAINWTCGQTGRGTEMLCLLYRNKMSADRNIFIQDGQIMIATGYHKSQAVTDDIKVTNSE